VLTTVLETLLYLRNGKSYNLKFGVHIDYNEYYSINGKLEDKIGVAKVT